MREREAEVLHYHERLWPIESTTCQEVFLDLSMSLGRAASCKNDRFPIIVPKGRIFKRCAMEWLSVPEAMACQGYDKDMAPALKSYGHRQVCRMPFHFNITGCTMYKANIASLDFIRITL